MGRFGFQPTEDIYMCVSTHGYFYVKHNGEVILDGPLSDIGIRYNPAIDDLDDVRISEGAEDGGWSDVNKIIVPFLRKRGII